MNTRSLHIPLLALVLLVTSGCAELLQALRGAVQPPRATFQSASLDGVSLEAASLTAKFRIDNPNAVGVSLAGLDYEFTFDGQKLFNGEMPTGLKIPPGGHTTLQIPVKVPYKAIPGLFTTLATRDEAPYSVAGSLSVRTPVGVVKVPMRWSGDLPIPKIPKVRLAGARVEGVSFTGAQVVVRLEIDNTNVFALPLNGLTGSVTVAGQPIAQLNVGPQSLEAKKPTIIELPLQVSFASAGLAVANALRSTSTEIRISGSEAFPGKTLPLDLATTLR